MATRSSLLVAVWHCLDSWKSGLIINSGLLTANKQGVGILMTWPSFAVSSWHLATCIGGSQRISYFSIASKFWDMSLLLPHHRSERLTMVNHALHQIIKKLRNRKGSNTELRGILIVKSWLDSYLPAKTVNLKFPRKCPVHYLSDRSLPKSGSLWSSRRGLAHSNLY